MVLKVGWIFMAIQNNIFVYIDIYTIMLIMTIMCHCFMCFAILTQSAHVQFVGDIGQQTAVLRNMSED